MKYRLPLVAHVLAVAFSAPVLAQTITLEQIGEIYRQKDEVLETLGVSYTDTLRPSIPEAELFRDFRVTIGPSNHYDAVQHRDGRYFCREDIGAAALDAPLFETLSAEFPDLLQDPGRLYSDVPYDRVREAMASIEIERAPRVFVYDGVDVFQYSETEELATAGVARPVFIKIDPQRLQGRFLPRILWDEVLLCAKIALPSEQEHRAQHRIPDIFTTASFSVRPDTESVGGNDCVVLDAQGLCRLYLDPTLAYAVRRSQWYFNDNLAFEVVASQFTEVAPDVWFPQEVEKTSFGVPGHAPSEYVGKPLYRVSAIVEGVEANRTEHLNFLSLDPQMGSWVVDETLRPMDEAGNPIPIASASGNAIPSVSYLVPADQSKLDEVISAAQRERGEALLAAQTSSRVQWVLLIVVPALLGVVFFFLYRRRIAT